MYADIAYCKTIKFEHGKLSTTDRDLGHGYNVCNWNAKKKIKKLRIRKKMNVRYCLIKKIHVINLASYDAFEITNL